MSERIVYHPWKVMPADAGTRGSAADHAPVSRPFDDILAEADAVRDSVALRRRPPPKGGAGLASGAEAAVAWLGRTAPGAASVGDAMRARRRRVVGAPADGDDNA